MIRAVLVSFAVSAVAVNKDGTHQVVAMKTDGSVFESATEQNQAMHSMSDRLTGLRTEESVSYPLVVPFHWPSMLTRIFDDVQAHEEPAAAAPATEVAPAKEAAPVKAAAPAKETPPAVGITHADERVAPAKLPEQGYVGKQVNHRDMESITGDWGQEYGPKEKPKHDHMSGKQVQDFLKSGTVVACVNTVVAMTVLSVLV